MALGRRALIAGAGAVGLAVAAAGAAGLRGKSVIPLVGNDYGRVRREALAMFPRGLPVSGVADALRALGFQCSSMRRLAPNINAPSVQCDSAGRGYPLASRMQITVMGRNGAVSDIAVGGGIDTVVADARTPDPKIAAPEPAGHGAPEGEDKPHATEAKPASH